MWFYRAGELLDKIPGIRANNATLKITLESLAGVRFGEISLGVLKPPPSVGQLWLLAQQSGTEFPIVCVHVSPFVRTMLAVLS